MLALLLWLGVSAAETLPDGTESETATETLTETEAITAISSGELFDTAQTLEPGSFCLHPLFLRSTLGVVRYVDVKFPIVGLILGPGASVEVGVPLGSERFAVSLEPYANTTWGLETHRLGAEGRFTYAHGKVRLNLNAGAYDRKLMTLGTTETVVKSTSIPVRAGIDLIPSESWTAQLSIATNVQLLRLGTTNWRVRAHYALGKGAFRQGFGLDLLYAEFPQLPEFLEMFLPNGLLLPLPYYAMWWRL